LISCQGPDWKPLHMFSKLFDSKCMCLECNDNVIKFVSGKDTNAIEHIKSYHNTKFPIDLWTEQGIKLGKNHGKVENAISNDLGHLLIKKV